MKIENSKILIVIELKKSEKKEKNQKSEKKEAKVSKGTGDKQPKGPYKNIIICTVIGILTTVAVIIGIIEIVSKNKNEDDYIKGSTYVEAEELASEIKSKYTENDSEAYGEPINGLGRDEKLEFQLGFDFQNSEYKDYDEVIGLYQDPELKVSVYSNYNWNASKKIITISPGKYTNSSLFVSNLDSKLVNTYEHSENIFFPKDEYEDWGNLNTMYMAVYIDFETGKKLDKPIVSIVHLQGELDAPEVTFMPTEDGIASFSWNEVKGAEQYLVVKATYDKKTGTSGFFCIGTTDETSWTTDAATIGLMDNVNKEFNSYEISEDDWLDDYDKTLELENERGEVVLKEEDYRIGVIAINQTGNSVVSNTFDSEDLASNLVNSYAYYTARENGVLSFSQTIGLAPTHAYVTMCDGTAVRKLIDYDIDNAKVVIEGSSYEDSTDDNSIKIVDYKVLSIPYHIEGTPFYDTFSIKDYSGTDLDKDLAELQTRQESLRGKSGMLQLGRGPSWETNTSGEGNDTNSVEKTDTKTETQIREVKDAPITANSALSEYLAVNLLGGEEKIYLDSFPEALDENVLMDALLEAYYQNPLILGIKSYQLSMDGKTLIVTYDSSTVDTSKKQKEILAKIDGIINSIITDDMTDIEKELAINKYLCDTIVYDDEALANAEENDYQYVDEKFNDSFTAYGALINGDCVCAGYAAAFKLLADQAGIESIVTTGMLDGTVAHAWNKVKIGGEWQNVDVTNNDNEALYNTLLNIPNYASDQTLVEDKDFVLDSTLAKYRGKITDNEYYRINNEYFDIDEIANQLAQGINDQGKIVLRTDYDIDDNQFYDITDAVYSKIDPNAELSGYYWLGVIYLEVD